MTSGIRVGVLYDSLSNNIGDIAMIDAARDGLSPHGITDVVPVKLLSAEPQVFDAVIVGGGELIRPVGDAFYDRFRYEHGFMLHAVGVWENANDLGYLSEYAMVSARTETETGYLRSQGVRAFTTPCPTTILNADHVDLPEAPSGRRNAIHLVPTALSSVPHLVETVNDIPGDHVLLPFTRYNGDRDFMRALPLKGNETVLGNDLSAREMRSVIEQSDFVVASSLHVTLFALAYGIPFVSYRQPKVLNYLKDRGLEHLTFDDDESLTAALERAAESRSRIEEVREQDIAACRETFASLARALHEYDGKPVEFPPTSADPVREECDLILAQTTLVRHDRDRLIHALFQRNITGWHRAAAMEENYLSTQRSAEDSEREFWRQIHYLEARVADAERLRGVRGTLRLLRDRVRTKISR